MGRELRDAERFKIGIHPKQRRSTAFGRCIVDIRHHDLTRRGCCPIVRHIVLRQFDAFPLDAKSLIIRLFNRIFTRNSQLVPEQRLQAIKVQIVVFEEVELRVIGLDVFLVQAVDDEHAIGRKFKTSDLRAE